jgi:hypothetical protein
MSSFVVVFPLLPVRAIIGSLSKNDEIVTPEVQQDCHNKNGSFINKVASLSIIAYKAHYSKLLWKCIGIEISP